MNMRKLILATSLSLLLAVPAAAMERANLPHALGDMYTDALNMVAMRGGLDTIDTKKQVKVTDIHMDHGQVFVTVAGDNGSATFTFDPIAHALVPPQ